MQVYQTTDLYLAAALKTALGLPFPDIQAEGRFSTFIFQVDPAQAQQAAERFYADTLTVPARRYAQDIRDLKTLIFQTREGQRP